MVPIDAWHLKRDHEKMPGALDTHGTENNVQVDDLVT